MTNVYFMVIQKGISSGVSLFYKKSLGRRQPGGDKIKKPQHFQGGSGG